MSSRERRFAENEMLFRSVNERIEDLGDDLLADGANEVPVLDFVCECHDTECAIKIPMTRAEYEVVRSDGRRFLVAPSREHVNAEVESIVDMSVRYWIVEKRGEAGDVADADDPRG